MDPVTLTFYGIVCGLLAYAAPLLGRGPVRFAVGLAVGLVAAGALPHLRAALGAWS